MAKSQLNVRVSDLTRTQLNQLITQTGMNQAEIFALAIDRMHREMQSWHKCPQCGGWNVGQDNGTKACADCGWSENVRIT